MGSDLKLNDLNVVEAYYKWCGLLQKMTQNKCHGCVKLEEHIKLAKEVKKHKEEVKALKFEMSDEALQQMPDFQGRVCFPDFIYTLFTLAAVYSCKSIDIKDVVAD